MSVQNCPRCERELLVCLDDKNMHRLRCLKCGMFWSKTALAAYDRPHILLPVRTVRVGEIKKMSG